MYGATRLDRIGVTNYAGKMKENRLSWFGHVWNDDGIVKIGEVRAEGDRGRGRPQKKWKGLLKEIWALMKYIEIWLMIVCYGGKEYQ